MKADLTNRKLSQVYQKNIEWFGQTLNKALSRPEHMWQVFQAAHLLLVFLSFISNIWWSRLDSCSLHLAVWEAGWYYTAGFKYLFFRVWWGNFTQKHEALGLDPQSNWWGGDYLEVIWQETSPVSWGKAGLGQCLLWISSIWHGFYSASNSSCYHVLFCFCGNMRQKVLFKTLYFHQNLMFAFYTFLCSSTLLFEQFDSGLDL